MTREQAIEIARKQAKKHNPSYYTEPFEPHEWVIDAILEAYRTAWAKAIVTIYRAREDEIIP